VILCCEASVAKSVSSCVPVALVSREFVVDMCRFLVVVLRWCLECLGTLVFLEAGAVCRGGKGEGKDVVVGGLFVRVSQCGRFAVFVIVGDG